MEGVLRTRGREQTTSQGRGDQIRQCYCTEWTIKSKQGTDHSAETFGCITRLPYYAPDKDANLYVHAYHGPSNGCKCANEELYTSFYPHPPSLIVSLLVFPICTKMRNYNASRFYPSRVYRYSRIW